jgi:hypothetical protein
MINIKIDNRLTVLKSVFNVLTILQKNQNMTRFHLRTLSAFDKLIESEPVHLVLSNKERLFQLKNNCIVASIRRQHRPPSVKQISIIEKILNDYDRTLAIDKLCDDEDLVNSTTTKYRKYGYVYPIRCQYTDNSISNEDLSVFKN